MKKDIHPEYYEKAKVTCACGNVFYVGSTQKEMRTEICYKCHPFYTGESKLVDTAGRVEKFKEKLEKAKKTEAVPKKVKRAKKKAEKESKKTKGENKK